ncbi:FAD:protein FMN transferase [Pontimicrobium sp. IMCC45349]|uniref:FAD:protein FMN transferase n=1 Tax=Pontimicrobium sp. IMCC45349 TaxID=3391574 RepID=UPI0039A142EC
MKKLLTLFLVFIAFSCQKPQTNIKVAGTVFGTSYQAVYSSDVNYEKQFDSIFHVINKSMSTYIPNSDISKINRNETVMVDEHFKTVLAGSKEVYRYTEGLFDPTIGAVVNAWDFGPEGKIENLDSLKINELMKTVGLNRVGLVNGSIQKPLPVRLDFNAIAKGYGVDVIGEFLESKGIENYLVEIGGEIRLKGINVEKEAIWKVGVQNPSLDENTPFLKSIELTDKAMATSGTYRKFKIDENGNRYAHIIDAKTGYPSKTNVLSVSVIADNCMMADAYATALQAMSIEEIKSFLEKHHDLQVFLIFENANKELETLALNHFPE